MEQILTRTTTLATAELEDLLVALQDTATAHAAIFRCDRETMLRDHHSVWMIVRAWLRLQRPLTAGELTIRTWVRPLTRSMSRREFDLIQDGVCVGEAVQAWVLTDVDSRRMLNMLTVQPMVEAPYCETGKDIPLRRPTMPQSLEVLGQVTVDAADIDANGHLNNAHYPRYALSMLEPRPVREMLISYSRECFAGDTVEIWGHVDQDHAALRGMVEEKDSFDLAVEFFPAG